MDLNASGIPYAFKCEYQNILLNPRPFQQKFECISNSSKATNTSSVVKKKEKLLKSRSVYVKSLGNINTIVTSKASNFLFVLLQVKDLNTI